MNVLVIGSGGREHALVWKIRQSPLVERIYSIPGNPGIEALAQCFSTVATSPEELAAFTRTHNVDLVVIGPEQPLAEGIVDALMAQGVKVFGPTRNAAELEWSKAFAKDFMARHGIPTARHRTFGLNDRVEMSEALGSWTFPLVLKADGLAAGKGVAICSTLQEAVAALHEMMDEKKFGAAGEKVVIEEFLAGEEASIFAVTDGVDYVTLAPAQDHKRILDDDKGKNTGGMGAYAPTPAVSAGLLDVIKRTIIEPTLEGMIMEGRRYKGCLYVGLMLTAEGPKVIEYNSRFGDPETQVVVPLYRGDIVELMLASCEERVGTLPVDARPAGSAVCVVLASEGYPDRYATGKEISGLQNLPDGIVAFHAGTKTVDGRLVTAGGRVLGVTAHSPSTDLEQTINHAYEGVRRIRFEGMHYRRDIGSKALLRRAIAT